MAKTDDKKEDDTKTDGTKKPATKKVASGTYKDGNVSGGGFTGTSLSLTVRPDGKIVGNFKGKREGKMFLLPLRGSVAKDGSFNASGSKGPNNAKVSGRAKDGLATGKVTGSINKKAFRVGINAKK